MRAWRAKRAWSHLVRALPVLGGVAWIGSASLSCGWRVGMTVGVALASAAAVGAFLRARRAFAVLNDQKQS